MPLIILMMAMGLAAGFLLRHRRMAWVAKVVTARVWLLRLLLGVEVGGNGMIIGNLHRLGLNALIIATLATAVSVAASVLLWRNTDLLHSCTLWKNNRLKQLRLLWCTIYIFPCPSSANIPMPACPVHRKDSNGYLC